MADVSKELLNQLDSLLTNTDFKDVSAEGAGYEDLTPGYYLAEVEKAELTTSKSSGNLMVMIRFKVVEDGITFDDETGDEIKLKGKNRVVFKYFTLKDEASVKRMASDMLKFEDDNGNPLLPKEAFTTSETLEDSLEVIEGMRVYLHITETEKNGEKSTWTNLISWKRAIALGLE